MLDKTTASLWTLCHFFGNLLAGHVPLPEASEFVHCKHGLHGGSVFLEVQWQARMLALILSLNILLLLRCASNPESSHPATSHNMKRSQTTEKGHLGYSAISEGNLSLEDNAAWEAVSSADHFVEQNVDLESFRLSILNKQTAESLLLLIAQGKIEIDPTVGRVGSWMWTKCYRLAAMYAYKACQTSSMMRSEVFSAHSRLYIIPRS